jgi:hypothetical protein
MRTTSIAIVAVCASLAAGCVSEANAQAHRARSVDGCACVLASRTTREAPRGAAAGCRSLDSDAPAWSEAWDLHLCGPCNFSYDDAVTRRVRAAGHADECCYRARSPGPPMPGS